MLKTLGSPKIKRGEYEVYTKGYVVDSRKMFSFSEIDYRHSIAAKYNIDLLGWVTPFLSEKNPEVVDYATYLKDQIKSNS